MRYLYKKRFLDAFDALSHDDQALARAADRAIREYHRTRRAPYGLRMKKLHASGEGVLFEARLSLSLRILWAEGPGQASFLLLGSHDELRRVLKRLA